MRPVGLVDPRTNRTPYAVVQLRQEDLMQSSYNIVGFQNHLKFSEQKRVFRMIPGLGQAEFLRLGQIHRNTYINAPQTLLPTMAAKSDPRVFFAGQLAGTEGYIENIASGLVAALNAVRLLRNEPPVIFPAESAIGALCRYISTPAGDFAPMNIHFGLLPALEPSHKVARTVKQRLLCERALTAMRSYESMAVQAAAMICR
jgi:methylenetetrahydrofolate--tRNA-(uracil-5-)-methyltransferase